MCSREYGTVYLNGHQNNLESLLDHVGFVAQEDIMYSDLSVEEAIDFSAKWRLPRSMSVEQRKEVVNETINVLKLEEIRHRRIGDVQKRGIR